ncbi:MULTISPECIES: acid resistance repetitive basic protein Asr [Yersinia pseudotuberculosis complex]|uniref:Acid shock protein n=1 Tax=Yersinia pseudotuberculosis serotype O:1b (strain IP 31758) TaxID=349747 RepID=A0A0U1QVV0_YERP3|nr:MULTISPECIES: acid resistance repetitive basic protein Asr [Yersinia pseudotuberculosis complex]ABS46649.1 acid shock protein [Yersinia pseudotuberculosis IP 31758]MCE4110770.1 acid resistance repetitive basic protein Asr [Yersinia pseudotuberculosis]RYC26689.1 acid resistance repetitive basic protein Asr [Yersinia pseudotuberculosis]UFA61485.1 Acid resistance repetitive basic protein Asr [Yersinia pseudotuberculosis]WLF05551.1 acid resistance repetitive basic protein Asr [Yersinia pseudotu
MKTVLALIVAATLSLSSVAFAADTVVPQTTPTATAPAPAVHNASAKTMHHKKAQKPNTIKNTHKTAPEQKAQTAQKHHKAAHSHKAPTVAPAAK